MTVETSDRQTVININLRDGNPAKQQSLSLKDILAICRIDTHTHWKLMHGEFADFWRADNHKETIYEPGKRGRKNRPDPRYHHEHVEYMVAVITGLMTADVARDLWILRKGMIRDELTSRALSLASRKKGTHK